MPRNHRRFILLVEDDTYIVSVFQRVFEGRPDFMLDIATKVSDALDKIKVVTYDLVFLDMKLGHSYAGMDILRALNRQEIEVRARGQAIAHSLVIIMTASINLRDVMEEAQQLGVLCFIDKPIPLTAEFVKDVVQRLGLPLLPLEGTGPRPVQ